MTAAISPIACSDDTEADGGDVDSQCRIDSMRRQAKDLVEECLGMLLVDPERWNVIKGGGELSKERDRKGIEFSGELSLLI